MSTTIPRTMKAAAIDRFGGPEVLEVKSLPVPTPNASEVLIQLASAGIGVWDPYARSGELEMGAKRGFPRVIGNDGAGTVVAVGNKVKRFKVGDRVYAYDFDGGFYAEYVAAPEEDVGTPPEELRDPVTQATDGIIAAVASLPGTIVRRLEAAFDESLD